MRRPAALGLVGVGVFFLALVPLLRFYVQDQVVAVPRNFYQATRLEARDASYFDTAELEMRTDVTLSARSTVLGDVRPVGGADVVVWDASTAVYDDDRDRQLEALDYRIAVNRRTSELVSCCGAHVAGDMGVRFAGYGLVLPPADVRKRDYQVFDVITRRPWPARFGGEERVQGLRTYRFVQEVGLTKVGELKALPGRFLGLGPRSGNVDVDRYYAARNTVWVDPRTGTPVKHEQVVQTTVRMPDGRGGLTASAARLVTVPADQKRLVARADRNALVIAAVRTYVPVGALSAGLLLVLTGGVVGLVGERTARRVRDT
ncbi:DUF3068 domain-containing protein [Actinomadura alba]|uniref:DUF3068 domain-containing protein n=1 Tax=Actinomadura alba TaxID=406431 RepID=A0ABR7LK83_9ACTN|nr:DUF3068 domain-containing protein [Actinomadura alba]MBC6464920.1 DUF3068 domain-containing protein [Actinomadura alba]